MSWKRMGVAWAAAGIVAVSAAAVPPQPEQLDRGMLALRSDDGVYVGWRLLSTDPADIGFNVYRVSGAAEPQKLTAAPITASTNYVDTAAPLDQPNSYFVRAVINGAEQPASTRAELAANAEKRNYISFKFQGNYGFQRVGIGDLDGDGIYDYVIKQPQGGLDPGTARFSVDTYKIEAYNGKTNQMMWRTDLGWNMNQGIWWTPMIVYDFDGDGKAEVAFKSAPFAATLEESLVEKTGPAAGFVLKGPEYCTIVEGATGKPIDQVNWIDRGNPESWGDPRGNRVNRNQIGVAYLDGQRPSLLVCRGTYTKMRVDAYNLIEHKLKLVWSWDGDDENPPTRGQGSHGQHSVDVDDDGKDEIILGSAVVDDNGKLLWSNGRGHPDHAYVADIIPSHPGYEIAYGYESRQESFGIQVADARTGKMIWGHDKPTTHIHDQGMLADIDPTNPGLEYYGGEQNTTGYFLYAAQTGKLLSSESLNTLSPHSFWWLDGPTKVYSAFNYRERNIVVRKFKQEAPIAEFPGVINAIADVYGDWREELLATVDGELRIYTTTTPATSRRVCLMQDKLYRMDAAQQSMGYFYPPQLGGKLFQPFKAKD
jgi:hypothetical protein